MDVIENLDVKQQIADRIIDEICAGNFQEGQELRQERIAQELGVSRIPVREAFILLETMGYIKKLPNRRIEIMGFSEERVHMELALLSKIEYEILSSTKGIHLDSNHLRATILNSCKVVSICKIYETLLKGSYRYVMQLLEKQNDFMQYDQKVCESYKNNDIELLRNTLDTYYELIYLKWKEYKV